MDRPHHSLTSTHMSLSLGQPLDAPENLQRARSRALLAKASRGDAVSDFCSIDGGGVKRKRAKYGFVSGKDARSLSFENDTASGLSLALSSGDCFSLSQGDFRTGKAQLWSTDAGDESHTELGLGLGGTQTRVDACNASMVTAGRSSLTSVSSGFRPYVKGNKGHETRGNLLTVLGLSQTQCPRNPDTLSAKESLSWMNISSNNETHPEMQLKLGLSGNSTIISEDGNISSMPQASEADGGHVAMTTENLCVDAIPVVDEGSTSARSITAGGYIPSLLMGLRPESIARCLEMQRGKPSFEGDRECVPDASNDGLVNEGMSQTVNLLGNSNASTAGMTSGGGLPNLAEKTSRKCKFKGCAKGSRGASGLCMSHGGGRRCERSGCNKAAEGRTIYCKSHGGGRRCETLGCTKSAEGKTDYCIGHGGGRRCSHDGCTKAARGRSGLCIKHGGGKRCTMEGCTRSAEGYSGLCISHGGGRRCQHEGCGKGAQGSTQFCKAHGGGKRCMIHGCNKGAEGSTPLCKAHGGGKRCMFEGGGICTKSVHGGTPFCVAHGGGKRCAVQGCTKSARGRTDFCVRHGGGKRCKVEHCTKSAQGSTDFCKAHGGGKRCQWGQENSPYREYVKDKTGDLFKGPCDRFARGKIGLCAAHSAFVQDQRVHGAGTIGNVLPAGIGPGLFRGLVIGASQKGTNLVHESYDNVNHSPIIAGGACSMMEGGAHEKADEGDVAFSKAPASGDASCKASVTHRLPDFMQGYAVGMKFSGSGSDKVGEDRQHINSITPLRSNKSMFNLRPNHAPYTRNQGRNVINYSLGKCRVPNSKLATTNSTLTVMATQQLPESSTMFHRPLLPPQVLVPPSMQKGSPFAAHQKNNSNGSRENLLNLASLSLPEERVHGNSVMALLTGNSRIED